MALHPLPAATPKLLVMTDIHLRGPGQTIIGLDPIARFQEALTAALTNHADASALILMGDLTHSGHRTEYEALRDILDGLPMPVIAMVGNHDNRQQFTEVFPEAPLTQHGHVQQTLDLPGHRIITLDTLDPRAHPAHSGHLCDARMAWLERALKEAGPRQPLVFCHHPPMPIGLPGMDAIALRNGPALLQMLEGRGAHLFCGHVHRTISGQTAGVPFTLFKSPCHQAPLNLNDADSTLSIAEPGAFGLVLLPPNGVIIHSEDVGLGVHPQSGNDALPDTDPDTDPAKGPPQ